jgi:hypothetical protein
MPGSRPALWLGSIGYRALPGAAFGGKKDSAQLYGSRFCQEKQNIFSPSEPESSQMPTGLPMRLASGKRNLQGSLAAASLLQLNHCCMVPALTALSHFGFHLRFVYEKQNRDHSRRGPVSRYSTKAVTWNVLLLGRERLADWFGVTESSS